MTAYEIADGLENAPYYTSYEFEAAAMLRIQAFEIKTLKAQLSLQRVLLLNINQAVRI